MNIFRIISASREIYTLEDGRHVTLTGKLRREAESLPVVGDYAVVADGGVIESIEPRKTELKRKDPSGGMQIMAANATHLLVVMALDENYSLRRLERFLILAESAGIKPITVLTKADTADPIESAVREFEVKPLCPVFVTSAVTGDGIDELKACFSDGDTVCLAGLSGAGKSTLLNALFGMELMKTSAVREDDSKGRHTTTARQLFRTESGVWIMDMPGIREVGLGADSEYVDDVFDDIAELARGCRFADCSHTSEPFCAVLEAVERGEISAGRLKSYHKLKNEANTESLKQQWAKKEKEISKLAKQAIKFKKR